MTTRRRWLQFSLGTAFVVLTAFTIGLGWMVERAHKQGRAIDRIVAAGGSVYYFENANRPAIRLTPHASHFWLDLKGTQIGVQFSINLVSEVSSQLSELHGVREVILIYDRADPYWERLERVPLGVTVDFSDIVDEGQPVVEHLQSVLPNTKLQIHYRSPSEPEGFEPKFSIR